MARMRRGSARAQRNVLGVDASLQSTGYSYRSGGQVITGTISAPKHMRGPDRLIYVRRAMALIVIRSGADLVVYEDYAKGKGGMGRTFDIGELGGVFKTLFIESGIDVMLVSPSALKKAITGRGDADKAKKVPGRKSPVKDKTKPEMRAALQNTFGVELRQGDEADACGLMLMGEMRFGSHTVSLATQDTLRLDALNECVIIQGHRTELKLIAEQAN